MGAGSKARRGPHVPATLKLPLPLAALCCFVFFYAGSMFGGKHFSALPDMRQPQKRTQTQAQAQAQVQVQTPPLMRSQGEAQDQGRVQDSGGHALDAALRSKGGVSLSRRQLTAHAADSQIQLQQQQQQQGEQLGGQGEGVSGDGQGGVRTVTLTLPAPYPHGVTGSDSIETIAMQMISWQPRAYVFPGFAPAEKCDAIVKLAKKFLAPSGLALRPGETSDATRDIRTSSGAFLASSQDPSGALAWVENKMARITMIPPQHGEAYNVLRYELGQHYDSHMDVFDPKEYGPQASNRVASFLLYLTDVEEGGETMFPYEGGHNMNIGYNYKDCIGLRVKPRKGDALLFWSMFPNGKIDPLSLHGSCPVKKGEKWVATKWIRDKRMHF